MEHLIKKRYIYMEYWDSRSRLRVCGIQQLTQKPILVWDILTHIASYMFEITIYLYLNVLYHVAIDSMVWSLVWLYITCRVTIFVICSYNCLYKLWESHLVNNVTLGIYHVINLLNFTAITTIMIVSAPTLYYELTITAIRKISFQFVNVEVCRKELIK